jgi:hypothetical protein
MSHISKSPAPAGQSALNNFVAQQLDKGQQQASQQQLRRDYQKRLEEQVRKREEFRLFTQKTSLDATLCFVNTAKNLSGLEVFNSIPEGINKSNIDLISRYLYTEFWIIKILTPADFEKLLSKSSASKSTVQPLRQLLEQKQKEKEAKAAPHLMNMKQTEVVRCHGLPESFDTAPIKQMLTRIGCNVIDVKPEHYREPDLRHIANGILRNKNKLPKKPDPNRPRSSPHSWQIDIWKSQMHSHPCRP